MGPYEKKTIKQESLSASVYKRPGMYFGDIEDGTGYAGIVAELVATVLSWKPGANLTLILRSGSIELSCRAKLPDAEIPFTYPRRRPFFVFGTGMAGLGFGWFGGPLHVNALACRQAVWELRDEYGEQTAVFDEGVCQHAEFAAPDLPKDLCFRVSLSIGTERLPIAPATFDQVCRRIRYTDGPENEGYWGCVTVRDERIRETHVVVVTDYPPRPTWRST